MLRFFLIAILLVFPFQARADYFLWQDPDSGLTITFPDTWKVQSNQKPDEVLVIMGPSAHDDPTCKVKVRGDRRFLIFPPRYGDAVQKVAVSQSFWEEYLREYDDYVIHKVHDGAGLGRWFASYALVYYSKHDGMAYQQRRSLMFSSLYNDKMYILECSSLNNSYEKWQYLFQSIVKSVDFKKAYNEIPTGEYDNFLKKADKYFWAPSGPEGTTVY